MARLRRGALGGAAAVAAATLLAACGGTNGDALTACREVHRALASYHASLLAPTPAQRARDLSSAEGELATAEQSAALANSADGTYNALMTLLQQAETLPIRRVEPSLVHTCQQVVAGNEGA